MNKRSNDVYQHSDAGTNVAEDIRKLNASVVEACGSMEQSIKRDLQSFTDTARRENERTEEMSMRTRGMIGAAQTALASQNTEALDRITMEFAEQSTVLHKIVCVPTETRGTLLVLSNYSYQLLSFGKRPCLRCNVIDNLILHLIC